MTQPSEAQVVIIDDFHPVFLQQLSHAGISYQYIPGILAGDVAEAAKHAQVVAVRSKIHFDKSLINALPNLKCIARGGAGMDNIDEAYALSKGIALLNAPEGNRDAVAEHTVGLLLGLSKKIVKSAEEVKHFKWEREENRGWEIGGKTIGLIGFGNTGSSVAVKLSGFGCKVIAYDKYKDEAESAFASFVSLEELLQHSDVLSLHVPLTAETHQMVDDGFISKMKNGAVLINTSRGKIVNTRAVLNGIKSGKIKSFATDVLENENLNAMSVSEKELFMGLTSNSQVIVTPHVGGWSNESYEKIATVLAKKILDFTIKIKNN